MPGLLIRLSGKNKYSSNLTDFLIGFGILAKGYAKLENHPHQLIKVLFIFFAGIFIILGAAFHQWIVKKIKNFTSLFHIAEGIALVFLGLIYLEEGSVRIPYFLFFIGIVYFMVGLTLFFTKEEKKELVQKRMQTVIGIAFLATGLVAFVLNQIYDKNSWVNIVSILLLGLGLIIIFKRIFNKKMRIFS